MHKAPFVWTAGVHIRRLLKWHVPAPRIEPSKHLPPPVQAGKVGECFTKGQHLREGTWSTPTLSNLVRQADTLKKRQFLKSPGPVS